VEFHAHSRVLATLSGKHENNVGGGRRRHSSMKALRMDESGGGIGGITTNKCRTMRELSASCCLSISCVGDRNIRSRAEERRQICAHLIECFFSSRRKDDHLVVTRSRR